MAVRPSGDVFITGHAQSSGGAVNFPGIAPISGSNLNIMFVARCSSTGTWLSALAGGTGGSASSTGLAIALDANGNAYATGSSSTGAAWGSLTPPGSIGAYVVKANSTLSTWSWVATAPVGSGGAGITNIGGVSYMTGSFVGSMTIGSTALTSYGGSDVLFACVNAAGAWSWARKAGTTYNDFGNAMSNNGTDLYATGSFGDASTPGGTPGIFGGITLNTLNNSDVFFARILNTGTINCAIAGRGTNEDNSYAINVNGKNSAIGGYIVSHDYTIGNTGASCAYVRPEAIVTRFDAVSLSPLTASICPGSGVVLTATGGGGSYTWSPTTGLSPTTGSPVTASPSSPTSYVVTANTTFGCKTSETSNISLKAVCTADAGPGGRLCCGPIVIGTPGSAGCTYLWSPTAGLVAPYNTAQVTCNSPGTYTVTVTNTASGCTSTDQAVVISGGPGSCCARIAGESDHAALSILTGNDAIMVSGNEDGNNIEQVRITDLSGKLIYNKMANTSNVRIDRSVFTDGFYFIAITFADGGEVMQKIILK